MVNIRKFDEDEVLEKICHIFWRKGYAATSLNDIIEATGVKRQSLYNAFGNKDDMFLQSFERYLGMINDTVFRIIEAGDGHLSDNVRKILTAFTRVVVDQNSPAGCFITNTAVEFGYRRREKITSRLRKHFHGIEDKIYKMLKTAKSNGTLAKDRDPRGIAQFLVASVTSIAVMYRINKKQRFANNVLNEILRVLD
jgi:TetR/AcrR family transcriptional repressor of nem operon